MIRAWLLIFSLAFLAFAPPQANACERLTARNACAAEVLGNAPAPVNHLPALLPSPLAHTEKKELNISEEPTPRAPQITLSPLQYKEVRTRGVPYHSDTPPPYLLPSVSS